MRAFAREDGDRSRFGTLSCNGYGHPSSPSIQRPGNWPGRAFPATAGLNLILTLAAGVRFVTTLYTAPPTLHVNLRKRKESSL